MTKQRVLPVSPLFSLLATVQQLGRLSIVPALLHFAAGLVSLHCLLSVKQYRCHLAKPSQMLPTSTLIKTNLDTLT